MSVGRELQGVIQPISQNFGKPLPQASVNKGKKREGSRREAPALLTVSQ
jgi:hypothetical protein